MKFEYHYFIDNFDDLEFVETITLSGEYRIGEEEKFFRMVEEDISNKFGARNGADAVRFARSVLGADPSDMNAKKDVVDGVCHFEARCLTSFGNNCPSWGELFAAGERGDL